MKKEYPIADCSLRGIVKTTLFLSLFVFSWALPAYSQHVKNQAKALESPSAIKEKYASLLKIDADSLVNINLYRMMEHWPAFAAKNGAQIKGHEQAVFAQYIYYLVYKTKIPAELQQIFEDEKTYAFKNTVYLRSGDLLFFGEKADQPRQLGVYLQNNILTYPSANGSMEFISLQEIKETYSVTAAKIVKDEEEARQ